MSSMLIHKPRRVWQPPTQGSPGGYRSHGTQGTQLSSADVPREAAAVEGIPLEFVPVRLEFRTRSHSNSNSNSKSKSESSSNSNSNSNSNSESSSNSSSDSKSKSNSNCKSKSNSNHVVAHSEVALPQSRRSAQRGGINYRCVVWYAVCYVLYCVV